MESSVIRPSRVISSNSARETQADRMPISSGSGEGGPGVRPVARKWLQCWEVIPCEAVSLPRGRIVSARNPVSSASSLRASSSGVPVSPWGKPPCGNDQLRRATG